MRRNWKTGINIMSMIHQMKVKPPKVHLPLTDRILEAIISVLLLTILWPAMILYILFRGKTTTPESSGR